MRDEVTALMEALASVMRKETDGLRERERVRDLASLGAAKARLVASLDAEVTRRDRVNPDWVMELEQEECDALFEQVADLRDAAKANADVLQRQMELSRDMMDAITLEAMRLTGARAIIYSAGGSMAGRELTTPISVNTEY
ncbi:flagellar biosynthesis protein FlgN [Novosphingobium profundi]|uniref:flagellar biosynthesis protein FlgN n=1 Tax=Novosphingobium profundi TaxID=1774954 RepID=UPI001BDA60D6|nr:flagellar biosynthesis protein FlgN [Novosphingobium profundi]MBT0670536.1 flagellar biosynthesis protein FlgN [Novosphingobium profundi]